MAEAIAWLVRWVGFVALAGLVGGLAVDLLVLSAHAPELGAVRGRLRALRLGSALVLLAASGGELLLRAATMSGAGLGAAGAAVPAVLTRTHFGAIWSTRAVMLLTLSPLAEKRETARRRIYLAAASIINIRSEVGADARDYFGQFLSSFRVAHLVPEGIGLRELAQDIHAQTTRWKKRRLYLQTLVVMFYSSIVWRFLGQEQRQRFHVKNWPVWVGVTMLNVDALWREGGATGPAPAYLRAVSTGPLSPMIVAVTTAGGALEAGISYRTGAFERATVDKVAAAARHALSVAGTDMRVGTVE